jgi:DNA-directed RNA polymerase subunit N (RpoN/RPB10)
MSQEIAQGWEAWTELVEAKHAALTSLDDLGTRCRRTVVFNAVRRWTQFNKAELKARLRAEQAVRTHQPVEGHRRPLCHVQCPSSLQRARKAPPPPPPPLTFSVTLLPCLGCTLAALPTWLWLL